VSLPSRSLDLREQLQRHLGETYVVERELGGGGSSRVFLATEIALQRRVVLKVLPPDVSASSDAERFRREILFIARLQHPHLVPLLNAGTVVPDGGGAGLRWFTMPYVEGLSLRELLMQRGALSLTEVLRLLRELASALSYAQARGIVHRDIKPENILLSEGVSMIADFGVAKALDNAVATSPDGKRVTAVGAMLGTPAYMAPEQIESARVVDHRADLYAFGCVAYELLTGEPPLLRASLQATLAAQVSETPEPVSQRRSDVPPVLADLIMQCLDKRPAHRLDSASRIVRALDELTQAVHTSGTFAAVPRGSTMSTTGTERVPTLPGAPAAAATMAAPAAATAASTSAASAAAASAGASTSPRLSPVAILGVAVIAVAVAGWWFAVR